MVRTGSMVKMFLIFLRTFIFVFFTCFLIDWSLLRNDSSEKRGICQRSGNDTTEDTEVTVFVNLDNPDEKLKVMIEEELSAGERTSAEKVYVDVDAVFTREGILQPRRIRWSDGKVYVIDRILDVRRAASLKAGGAGIRYTCRILGYSVISFMKKIIDGLWKAGNRNDKNIKE